jgi:hypothetical protein
MKNVKGMDLRNEEAAGCRIGADSSKKKGTAAAAPGPKTTRMENYFFAGFVLP